MRSSRLLLGLFLIAFKQNPSEVLAKANCSEISADGSKLCLLKCENGGSCLADSNNRPKCECKQGFSGRFCQFSDPCERNPCRNNGKCYGGASLKFRCDCPFGYRGDLCEIVSCVCQNGGNCTDKGDCECSEGFSGDFCENTVPIPLVLLNISILHQNLTTRNVLLNSFKRALFEKFKLAGSEIERFDVTNHGSDVFGISFRFPENFSVQETLELVRNIQNPSAGVALRNVAARIQNGNELFAPSEEKSSLRQKIMVGAGMGLFACLFLFTLLTIIRTQTVIRGIRWVPDEPRNRRISVGHGNDFGWEDFNLRAFPNHELIFHSTEPFCGAYRRKLCDILKSNFDDSVKASELGQFLAFLASHSLPPQMLLSTFSCLNPRTGDSAAHLAAKMKLLKCFDLLLWKFPDLARCRDAKTRTVLHISASLDSPAFIKRTVRALSFPGEMDVIDSFGRTPLQQAVLMRSKQSMIELIRCGAKIDLLTKSSVLDSRSTSALHIAVEIDFVDGAHVLLENGADVNILNDERESPLFLAVRSRNLNMAALLITRRAILNTPNKLNETPFSLTLSSSEQMKELFLAVMGNLVVDGTSLTAFCCQPEPPWMSRLKSRKRPSPIKPINRCLDLYSASANQSHHQPLYEPPGIALDPTPPAVTACQNLFLDTFSTNLWPNDFAEIQPDFAKQMGFVDQWTSKNEESRYALEPRRKHPKLF